MRGFFPFHSVSSSFVTITNGDDGDDDDDNDNFDDYDYTKISATATRNVHTRNYKKHNNDGNNNNSVPPGSADDISNGKTKGDGANCMLCMEPLLDHHCNRPSQNPAFPPYDVRTLHLRGISTPRLLPSLKLIICNVQLFHVLK